LLLPYRSINGIIEPGLPFDMEKCKENNKVIAIWADGSEIEMKGITVAEIEHLMNVSKSRMPGDLWSGVHRNTNNIVTIKQKVDRSLLLILMEQKKQICMCKLNIFGPIADERYQLAESDPVLVKGVEFLKKVGMDYITDKVERSKLLEHRNKLLDELGVQTKQVRKRPAAAPPSCASSKRPAAAPAVKDDTCKSEDESPDLRGNGEDLGDGASEDDELADRASFREGEEEEEEESESEKVEDEEEEEEPEDGTTQGQSSSSALPSDWSMAIPRSATDAAMDRFSM
jgi:hypothetical protein